MAFERTAIAVRWIDGRHEIIAEMMIGAGVDWASLEAAFPFYDVSDHQGAYIDRATLLPVHRFREFVTAPAVRAWLDGQARGAAFILIHAAEWESGLGDN